MPTGYTASIAKGISFNEYALLCARAFGACVMMRDSPMDEEIPGEFKPSDYHKDRLEEAKKHLEKVKAMSLDECEAEAKLAYERVYKECKKSIKENEELKAKYESMLAKVEAYVPPTEEYVNFKKFMRDQIADSIRFDCSGDYYEKRLTQLKQMTGEEWRESEIDLHLSSIEYEEEQHKEEIERCAGRTKWMRELRNSLHKHKSSDE